MIKKHFSVSIPNIYCRLMMFICLMCLGIPVMFSIFQGEFLLAAFIAFAIFGFPFLCASVWMKLFRVDVDEDKIVVRRGIGTKYSFTLADIEKVVCIIRPIGVGTSKAFQIYLKGHKLSVGNMMDGFEKMDVYIQNSIPQAKIIQK